MNLLLYNLKYCLKEKKKGIEYFKDVKYDEIPLSCEYKMANSQYDKDDLKKTFIDKFIKRVKKQLKINVFNCKFRMGESRIYFIIYLENLNSEISWEGDDKKDELVKIFYQILNKYKLPGIDRNTNIDFCVKNYEYIYRYGICYDVYRECEIGFNKRYKNVSVEMCHDGQLIVLIDDKIYEKYINNEKNLKKYRETIIENVKKYDKDNRIELNKFKILATDKSKK